MDDATEQTSERLNRRSLLRLSAQATVAACASIGGRAVATGDSLIGFSDLARLSPPSDVHRLRTGCFATPGDGGGATYASFDFGSRAGNDAVVASRPLAATRTANGRYFAIAAATLNPRQFGARAGDGNDAAALQAAFDEAARTGARCIVDQVHNTEEPIYLPANATIEAAGGKIVNVRRDGNPQELLALVPGNYAPSYFARARVVACRAVAAGQRQLTPVSTRLRLALKPGDIVHIRSREHYDGGAPGYLLPLVRTFNRVSSDWDERYPIRLDFPILAGIANPLLSVAGSEGVLDALNRRPLYVCYNARILGGLDLESVNGHALERGGALGCEFHFGRISGLSGLHTNSIDHSTIRVDSIAADRKLVDLGGGFHGTTVTVGEATWRKSGRSADTNLVALNECLTACTVTIGTVDAKGFDYTGQGICFVGAVSGLTARIGPVLAPDSRGCLFMIVNYRRDSRRGETQSVTSGAKLALSGTTGPNAERYVLFVDQGGRLSDVSVDGNFRGPVKVAGVTAAGRRLRISGSYEANAISVQQAPGALVDSTSPLR